MYVFFLRAPTIGFRRLGGRHRPAGRGPPGYRCWIPAVVSGCFGVVPIGRRSYCGGRRLPTSRRYGKPSIPKTCPELLVYSLPHPEDFEHDLGYAQRIRDRLPSIKIVALAEAVDPAILLRTIPLGVDCILLNDASSELLRYAIEFVLLGQQIFPLGLVQAAVSAGAPPATRQDESPTEYPLNNRIERARGRTRTLSEQRSPDREVPCAGALKQGSRTSTERYRGDREGPRTRATAESASDQSDPGRDVGAGLFGRNSVLADHCKLRFLKGLCRRYDPECQRCTVVKMTPVANGRHCCG